MTPAILTTAAVIGAAIVALAVFKAWAINRHHARMARRSRHVVESPGANVIVLPTQRTVFDRHSDQAIALTVDGLEGSKRRHPAGGPR